MTDREKNKQLIKEYPFLKMRSFGRKREKTDYSWTLLDSIPHGWKQAFGEQMCADIKAAIMEDDPSGEKWKSYYVSEAKEKYGELRWYDSFNGGKKEDVMWVYEYISRYTCVRCGKINVPVFDDGWVSPYCLDCFKDYRKRYTAGRKETDEDITKFMVEDANLTRNIWIRSYNSQGYSIRSIDCSDTLRRLGFDPTTLPYDENPEGEQSVGKMEGAEQ